MIVVIFIVLLVVTHLIFLVTRRGLVLLIIYEVMAKSRALFEGFIVEGRL